MFADSAELSIMNYGGNHHSMRNAVNTVWKRERTMQKRASPDWIMLSWLYIRDAILFKYQTSLKGLTRSDEKAAQRRVTEATCLQIIKPRILIIPATGDPENGSH